MRTISTSYAGSDLKLCLVTTIVIIQMSVTNAGPTPPWTGSLDVKIHKYLETTQNQNCPIAWSHWSCFKTIILSWGDFFHFKGGIYIDYNFIFQFNNYIKREKIRKPYQGSLESPVEIQLDRLKYTKYRICWFIATWDEPWCDLPLDWPVYIIKLNTFYQLWPYMNVYYIK